MNNLELPLLGLADDLLDEWEHESHRTERDAILDAVFAYAHGRKKTVAFLSGDVHIGGAFRLSRKHYPDARVYQLTASGITYPTPALLELAVKEAGQVGHPRSVPDEERTAFIRLHLLNRNNFGLITAEPDAADGARVSWDPYGSTGEEDEIVKLKRVSLT